MKFPQWQKCFLDILFFSTLVSAITNENPSRDTYISAYIDSRSSTTEQPLGVVYPESYSTGSETSNSYVAVQHSNSFHLGESHHEPYYDNPRPPISPQYGPPKPYGPPQQHYPPPSSPVYNPHSHHHHPEYYGHQDFHSPPYYGPLAEPVVPLYAPPLLIPGLPAIPLPFLIHDKFGIFSKIGAVFVGIAKIFLKVVVIKMILKLFAIFAAFFIFPKLELLADGGALNIEHDDQAGSSENETNNEESGTEETHSRGHNQHLNNMTQFVMDSIDGKFLNAPYCQSAESMQYCKIQRALSGLDSYASVSRLFNWFWFYEQKKGRMTR